jgi:hypothetical protein
VLTLSNYSILSLPERHIVDAYLFFLVFPSHIISSIFPSVTCFRRWVSCAHGVEGSVIQKAGQYVLEKGII